MEVRPSYIADIEARLSLIERLLSDRLDVNRPTSDPHIGRLCWVWDDPGEEHKRASILKEIRPRSLMPFRDIQGIEWAHAELVQHADLEKTYL